MYRAVVARLRAQLQLRCSSPRPMAVCWPKQCFCLLTILGAQKLHWHAQCSPRFWRVRCNRVPDSGRCHGSSCACLPPLPDLTSSAATLLSGTTHKHNQFETCLTQQLSAEEQQAARRTAAPSVPCLLPCPFLFAPASRPPSVYSLFHERHL